MYAVCASLIHRICRVAKYQDLQIWQRSHQLTLAVYGATLAFPQQELYGLTSQMRRASASIAANIAEGCGRKSDTELARFLRISLGSANELHSHLRLARDLGFLDEARHVSLSDEALALQRMLATFIQRLKGAS
jgi:four helix bundle protein